jgi:GNAT superfamily N-acetyltransferase
MEARPATSADAPELIRLGALMFASMGLDVDAPDWREHAQRVLGDLLGTTALAAFAVDDPDLPGKLCASGGVTVTQRLPSPATPDGRWGHVQWMATDPEHRRKGYARAVFAAIVQWLQDQGVAVAELNATADAEALYRSFGFSDPRNPSLRMHFNR